MKKGKLFLIFNLLLVCLALTGCRRNTNAVWEDSKTAGRHLHRGVRAFLGKNTNSRQVKNRGEFMPGSSGYNSNDDFIALSDDTYSGEIAMLETKVKPPRESPGEPGSSVPGIDSFADPSTVSHLAGIFKNIQFDYNSNLVKGSDNLATVKRIADYMKKNPNTYIFVEGHCDEKGPEAFNFALGARRSNTVRNLLIDAGVSNDNIFTISYGKERPIVLEHHEEAWSKNRRVEFKVYQR